MATSKQPDILSFSLPSSIVSKYAPTTSSKGILEDNILFCSNLPSSSTSSSWKTFITSQDLPGQLEAWKNTEAACNTLGWIRFATRTDAASALAHLNKLAFSDHELQVVHNDRHKKGRGYDGRGKDDAMIMAMNLPKDVGEDLWEAWLDGFKLDGFVAAFRDYTHKSRGNMGFAAFADVEAAKSAAKRINGQRFQGKCVMAKLMPATYGFLRRPDVVKPLLEGADGKNQGVQTIEQSEKIVRVLEKEGQGGGMRALQTVEQSETAVVAFEEDEKEVEEVSRVELYKAVMEANRKYQVAFDAFMSLCG